MNKFIIETPDHELVYAIWDLKTNEITIEESLLRSEGFSLREVVVYIELGTALLTFAAALFELIKAKQRKGPHTTKTIIHTRKKEMDLKQLVMRYEESIHIEVHDED
jgi:hypothetical protein